MPLPGGTRRKKISTLEYCSVGFKQGSVTNVSLLTDLLTLTHMTYINLLNVAGIGHKDTVHTCKSMTTHNAIKEASLEITHFLRALSS